MSTIIGTDAAKLAGLQIDMLSKFRSGSITLDHIEWFNNISKDTRDAHSRGFILPGGRVIVIGESLPRQLVNSAESISKFGLLMDLGVIVVPANYKLVMEFERVVFPNPTHVLKPGDRLWIRAHKHIVNGNTTSKQRLAFLKTLGSHLIGHQGIELVRSKRWELPKGYWYTSFDDKEHLSVDSTGLHRLPSMYCSLLGSVDYEFSCYEATWYDSQAFFSFCDVPSGV